MDAPPTQYRVIERGGRLIVLEARTNLPPKRAADLQPGRQSDRTPERVSARELFDGNAATKREAERTGRKSTAMEAPKTPTRDRKVARQNTMNIPGIVIGMIAASIFVGGMIGLAIAAAAILYAGYAAIKAKTPKN